MPHLPAPSSDSLLARWAARLGGGRFSPRGVKIASLGLGLAIGLVVVGMLFAMQVSSTPKFCGTCHIMKPYYESWRHSKHNQIACVDCHIAPGITAELRKKYQALSMVVTYFTGTYGTNPWTEVEDAACLRCHERRLLEGKVVFHDVLFDHTPHLTESRRGLKLRCTSCHSQIVQGSHITVTSSTCALCHFKGQNLDEGTGACLSCHQIPERVTNIEGGVFDHSQVGKMGVECSSCHAGVVRGDGAVPRERCLTCHNQVDRLARYGEMVFLHEVHVSRHKVDCVTCHLQVEHGKAPPLASHTSQTMASGGSCEACHGSGHNAQQALYSGIGGRDVPRIPSPMFAAGVTCQGCHNPRASAVPASTEMLSPHTQRAGAVSCMSCHGPTYLKIYEGWKQGVDSRVASLRTQLEATAGAMGLSPPEAWENARHNFGLVDRGKGVHNVNFSFALLEKAHEQMNEARRSKGMGRLDRPWAVVAAGSGKCLDCHQGIEKQSGVFAGHTYAHGPHVVTGKIECTTCHRPHEERAPGEVVRFGKDGCVPCHHLQAEVSAPACMKCHVDVTTRTVASFRGEFSHKAHLETGMECGTCHAAKNSDPRPDKSACAECHEGE